MTMASPPTVSRLKVWVALFIFSCVCILAHATSIVIVDTAVNWVTGAISISIIFSALAVLAYYVVKDVFVGQLPEVALAVVLLIFWCACLPAIMNPSNAIAVAGSGQGVIRNSNLYFFSWISFGCILFIVGDVVQEITGRNLRTEFSPKSAKWFGLLATSIVVLASSSMIYQDYGCSGQPWAVCQRTNYAISLGVLGIVITGIALVATPMGKMTPTIEIILSSLLFVLYVFGVGFLTFSEGPATTLGNLYFASWIGFIVSFILLAECFDETNAIRNLGGGGGTTTSAPAPALADIEEQEGPTDNVGISLQK